MQGKKSNLDSKNVKIYIDTCILQGALSRRNTKDTIFLDRIREKGWGVFTSIHTLMELLDIAKDRQYLIKKVLNEWGAVSSFLRSRDRRNLNMNELDEIGTEIANFFTTHKNIILGNITEDVWSDVMSIGQRSNIHSSDAIHLALALMWECQVLVTHDQFFIREGNKILKEAKMENKLRVCDVDNVEETIKEISS